MKYKARFVTEHTAPISLDGKRIILLISVGQKYHEADRFLATINRINTFNVSFCQIMLADTLHPTLPFLKLNLSKSMTYILKKRLGSLQLNKLFFQCAQVVNSCLTIYRSQLALELPLRFF